MRYSALWKLLKAAGWEQEHGAKRGLAVDPKNIKHKIIVPRHKGEVPTGTADSIPSEARLK